MTIVVDVGCMSYPDHPGDESVRKLIKRFSPAYLFGFDPHPLLSERPEMIGETLVIRSRKAAWTADGFIGFVRAPAVLNDLRSYVSTNEGMQVACFDLAEWLFDLGQRVVLKIDAEGAEHALVPHLVRRGAIDLVELLLVEWHGEPEFDLSTLDCPVEAW